MLKGQRAVAATTPGGYNVLYVVLEDFSTLSSPLFSPEERIGHSRRHTPHLARLAARGVTFRRVYCQAPICNPSRTSFLTSRRPSTTRVYSNDDTTFPALPTLVDFLAQNSADGASVACTGRGKIFHVACDVEPRGFVDGSAELRRGSLLDEATSELGRALNATISRATHAASTTTDTGRWSRSRVGAALQRLRAVPPAVQTLDQDKASTAALLLAHFARRRQRFFLATGLASTHVHGGRICIPNAARAERARPLAPQAPLARERATERDPPLLTWPNWDITQWDGKAHKQVPRFGAGYRWQREAVGEYHACAAHVDAQIGALLDALDALHLTASTAVVVQGDHGFSLGRHGRWSKYNLYEDATRVPLIIALPGGAPKVVDDVVEALDVMPTILDLWGVRRREGPSTAAAFSRHAHYYELGGSSVPLDGLSLAPYLGVSVSRNPRGGVDRPRARRIATSEMHEWMLLNRPLDRLLPGAPPRLRIGRGTQLYVRSERYAYTAYLRRLCSDCTDAFRKWAGSVGDTRAAGYRVLDEQLFDHRTDPSEAINLAYVNEPVRRLLMFELVREWNVSLVGPPDPRAPPNRSKRLAALREEVRAQERRNQQRSQHQRGRHEQQRGAGERKTRRASGRA